jgi:DNA-binding transcriptional ArsR family regulator
MHAKISAAARETWLYLSYIATQQQLRGIVVIRYKELAEDLGVDRSTISRRIARLVAAGAVLILGRRRGEVTIALSQPDDTQCANNHRSNLHTIALRRLAQPRHSKHAQHDKPKCASSLSQQTCTQSNDANCTEQRAANMHTSAVQPANPCTQDERAYTRVRAHARAHALSHENKYIYINPNPIHNPINNPIHNPIPSDGSVVALGDVVPNAAQSLERKCSDRAAKKDAMVRSLTERLPGLGIWYARKVVHLVTEPAGDSRPALPRSVVEQVLELVDRRASLPADHPHALREPARALFIAAMSRRVQSLGIPWPHTVPWHQAA